MSRKSRIVSDVAQEDYTSPKIWVANRGYSEYKPDLKTGRLRDAVVLLYHKSYCRDQTSDQHPLVMLGGILGKLLSQNSNLKNLISVDISSLIPDERYEEWMDEEGASINLEKKISKPCCRMLEKMFLHKATIIAFDSCCQLLLKIIPTTIASGKIGHKLTAENVSRLIFVNPVIPPRCVNVHFRGSASSFASEVKADILFYSDSDCDRRLPVLRSIFSKGESTVRNFDTFEKTFSSVLCICQGKSSFDSSTLSTLIMIEDFITNNDLEATNDMGETIWMSEMTIAMDRNSKQYVQSIENMTNELLGQFLTKANKSLVKSLKTEAMKISNTSINTCETGERYGNGEIGGLVLRGNRCVLVRSLKKRWEGMRFPSVPPKQGELPQNTAIRAVTELCDIDADEVYVLSDIPPLSVYRSSDKGSGNMSLYIMYAVQPPPTGLLEDQDCEDDEDLYDWYTWHRAIESFKTVGDENAILTLRTVACALAAASIAGDIFVYLCVDIYIYIYIYVCI
jgi:hypothetical protein